jgi:hypothetical protein
MRSRRPTCGDHGADTDARVVAHDRRRDVHAVSLNADVTPDAAAARLRRDVGESVESVSASLDHSTLATTTVYLRRLEGQRDGSWGWWRR